MNEPLIIGLDVGGTKTAVVLGSAGGTIRWRRQFATRSERGFSAVFEELISLVREALAAAGGRAVAISVSIGGPLDILQGVIKNPPNLPGWDNIPLKRLLGETFDMPVYVEHDGNAGALAEFYFGAGRGFQNIVFLTMGTGFGAGLILGGRVYRGSTDVAGEIGHIRIAEEGPPCYGKPGSLEGYASGTGIALLAQAMFPARWPVGVTTADLDEGYRRGSSEARKVLERASFYLGRGFAMIADFLNPQRIIVGGIGMRMFDSLVEPALAIFRQEALREASDACVVVPVQLGESIGDTAALCAALDQMGLRGGSERDDERGPS
jgi:glucokinase